MSTFRIGDLCTWSKGFQVPRDDTSTDKAIPYLHYGDLYKLYGFRLNLPKVYESIIKIDSNPKIYQEQYLSDGDIVFTLTSETVDDLGHCTLILNPDNAPFVAGMETTVVHIKRKDLVLPAYLNYCFQNAKFQNELRQYHKGMKVYRVHPNDLMNLVLDLPSIEEQTKVVSLLDSISDEVEICAQVNDNLMSILETEYQKIKCDYSDDYVLSDLCEIVKDRGSSANLSCGNYYSTENMLPNKAGVSPAASLPSDGKATVCKKGDVLISNIRPYFKKIHYCSELSGCSADVLCFRSKQIVNSPYLFSILHSDEFFDYVVAGSKGTKMPRGDKEQIMDYPIPIPSEKELQSFNSIGNNILSTVSDNAVAIKQLAKLRDYILPKLMSGEIDVSTLEIPN